MASIETDNKYISPENLASQLKSLGQNFSISHGSFEHLSNCILADIEWNHMDQAHRAYTHRTYDESVRFFLSPSVALSVTRAPKFPLLFCVTDIRLRSGLYYQAYTVLGVFFVHAVIQAIPQNEKTLSKVDWYIVSHPWLKIFHPFMIRWLQKMNKRVNKEDDVIRNRRTELRKLGYNFIVKEPDYISSNLTTNNVVAPSLYDNFKFSLSVLETTKLTKFTAGTISILAKKGSDNEIYVWPEACPHEGASLECGNIKNKIIQCPWHGFKFSATCLSSKEPTKTLGNLELTLQSDYLVVSGQKT